MDVDLLVYHDFSDRREDASVPAIGTPADTLYGDSFKGLYVSAVGPGIHEGRVTIVLSHEHRPEQQGRMKEFFGG